MYTMYCVRMWCRYCLCHVAPCHVSLYEMLLSLSEAVTWSFALMENWKKQHNIYPHITSPMNTKYDIILTAHPDTELSVILKRIGQIGVNICIYITCMFAGGGEGALHLLFESMDWLHVGNDQCQKNPSLLWPGFFFLGKRYNFPFTYMALAT